MSATTPIRLLNADRPTAARRTTRARPLDQAGRANHVGLLAAVVLGASVFVAVAPANAAQGPVGLGTADSFAVLAGSGITNTGPTTIRGDVGTFPTPSETGFGSITLSGTNHAGDAVTQNAKGSLVTAYNDAAGRKPAASVPVELGGSRLLAGVYTSPTLGLTGTLTLDAQGNTNAEFIFQAGSTLITASNSRVLLVNGADPCHVVWQIGSSATFNTGTQFIGDVLSHVSITAQTGATFQGRLLARDGAVTLDHNVITNANCITETTPTTVGPTSTTVGPTSTTVGSTAGTKQTPAPPAGQAPTVQSPSAGTPAPGATPSAATPSAVPGPSSPPAGPGSPTGTPGVPPAGTPGGTPPRTTTASPSPPFLAFTGIAVGRLVRIALVLIMLGAFGVIAARFSRKADGWKR